jgi:hypothetical protein
VIEVTIRSTTNRYLIVAAIITIEDWENIFVIVHERDVISICSDGRVVFNRYPTPTVVKIATMTLVVTLRINFSLEARLVTYTNITITPPM